MSEEVRIKLYKSRVDSHTTTPDAEDQGIKGRVSVRMSNTVTYDSMFTAETAPPVGVELVVAEAWRSPYLSVRAVFLYDPNRNEVLGDAAIHPDLERYASEGDIQVGREVITFTPHNGSPQELYDARIGSRIN